MAEFALIAAGTPLLYLCLRDNNQVFGADDKVYTERVLPPAMLRLAGSGVLALIFPAAILGDMWLSPHSPNLSHFKSSPSSSSGTHLSTHRLIGYIIFMCGGALRYWSMRTLGKYFTFRLSIRAEHKIIRSGPYGIVRNPSYTGMHIMICAFIIIMQNGNALRVDSPAVQWVIGLLLAFVVGPLVMTSHRIRSEEKMLAENFVDDWEAYKREVPYRLIPYVW